LTVSLLPLLRAGATKEDPGRIINIGSVNGKRVSMFESYAYTSSKAAVAHLSRHLASRLAKENITVNTIAAGPFPTKMISFLEESSLSAMVPLGRVGSATDIGGTCVFLASKASAWITGATLTVDGGSLIRPNL